MGFIFGGVAIIVGGLSFLTLSIVCWLSVRFFFWDDKYGLAHGVVSFFVHVLVVFVFISYCVLLYLLDVSVANVFYPLKLEMSFCVSEA